MVHARDSNLDSTSAYPSLIGYLAPGTRGFYLDLALADSPRDHDSEGALYSGPFSKSIRATIKTDGQDGVRDVLVVRQRDHYDFSDALVPVGNTEVEAAWQKAFAFYNQPGHVGEALFFKDQISSIGQLRPFQSLFVCRDTKRWFHPMCPECRKGLTLCRDDALLKTNGLPAYADSLERFLFCPSCSARGRAAAFYARVKTTAMPTCVMDAQDLATQWQQGRDPVQPCQDCQAADGCLKNPPGAARIVPFSFYPFYMLMVPAPACDAATFMGLLSGHGSGMQKPVAGRSGSPQDHFLFQDEKRFLEILFLKLTFLEQVIRQCLPVTHAEVMRDVGLSLEGIGIDLHPPGAGLPAYWNFSTRILDAIGTLNRHPFAPAVPEAPYYHFLGAVWFRALLVNPDQSAATVYQAVGRLVTDYAEDAVLSADDLGLSDPASVFAAGQLFDDHHAHESAQPWPEIWMKALTLGIDLVRAGLKTTTHWNQDAFMDALAALRDEIKTQMFAGANASRLTAPLEQTDRIKGILGTILEKWQRAAASVDPQPAVQKADAMPDGDDLAPTMVISPPMASASSSPTVGNGHGAPGADPQADGSAGAPAPDLAATRIINPAGPVPASPPDVKADPDATVIIAPTGGDPAAPTPSTDHPQTIEDANDASGDDIMEQTVIIQSDTK
jgi:hypothetical protein